MTSLKIYQGIDALYDKVARAWEPFGNPVSNLPEELRERHMRSYRAAHENARRHGREAELGDDD